MSTLKGKESIFDSPSQRIDEIIPAHIRPMEDLVVVKDIPDEEAIGSIVIPNSARDRDQNRRGLVVAVGLGDRFYEKGKDPITGEIRRRTVGMCECGCPKWKHVTHWCMDCECNNFSPRLPMEVKVGDRVLFNRRKDMEFFIDGDRYNFVHEEQSILAILD